MLLIEFTVGLGSQTDVDNSRRLNQAGVVSRSTSFHRHAASVVGLDVADLMLPRGCVVNTGEGEAWWRRRSQAKLRTRREAVTMRAMHGRLHERKL